MNNPFIILGDSFPARKGVGQKERRSMFGNKIQAEKTVSLWLGKKKIRFKSCALSKINNVNSSKVNRFKKNHIT